MDKILVSIITPTYNQENFIGKCIESVLAQTYQHWEQIIVDDGFDDDTKQKIAKYHDKRIRYIKQENKGIWRLNETYNTALKHSNGEIISILEGDDFWPPDKLEKQLPSFKDPEVVLSWGKAVFTDANGEFIGYRPKSIEWLKKLSNKKMLNYLFFGDFIPACTVMCRKDALTDINGFKQPIKAPYVDYSTWLELVLKGKFYYLDEILGYWRHHNKQISTSMISEMIESSQYSIEFFKKKISKKNSFHISVKDLIKFNLVQIKYNIIYTVNDLIHKDKNEKKLAEKCCHKKPLYLRLNTKLRIIYAIFKINIIWIIVLTINAF